MSSENRQPINKLAETLVALRRRYRMSQQQVADHAGSSRAWLSEAENYSPYESVRFSREMVSGWGRAFGRTDEERRENERALLAAAGYAVPEDVIRDPGTVPDIIKSAGEHSTELLRQLVQEQLAEILRDPRLRPVSPTIAIDQRLPAGPTQPSTEISSERDRRQLYRFQVAGDSMEPTIHDGEWVIVDVTADPQVRQILAVLLDGEWTVKRLRRRNGIWLLVPDNINYDPIEIDPTVTRILGVVVGVWREV